MLDLGRNKAKIQAEKPEKAIFFNDVVGVDEAVEKVAELQKSPEKFTCLGFSGLL
ncbi:hypothetical protein ACMA1I_08495 [Pontibacter sp. 13R65]|uniref:hypothetical protein n=1 Tax=Pontibacter sp. 13R65 TaxID=3127458 RepID=UPI00301C3410